MINPSLKNALINQLRKHRGLTAIVGLILLIIPTISALVVSGFYGASDDIHVAWVYEMSRTIAAGQIPPRYVPDLSYGFGYPLFNFVFPLPYYLANVFHGMRINLVDSVKIVFGLSLILASIAMYGMMRQLTGRRLSFAAALIYTYTSYRAIDIYQRGDFGEAVAFIFFPLVGWAILRITKQPSFKWAAIGGLALAGLVLAHNIATYMILPFFIVLGLILIWKQPLGRQKLTHLALMALLGLGIAAYFWVPALVDSRLMKYETVFNYVDHFPSIWQLVAPQLVNRTAAPDPYNGDSFQVGWVNLVILVIGCGLFFFRKSQLSFVQKTVFLWAGGSFVFALFMMNNRSLFLWQSIPLLPYFQFPWRFLMVTTFLTPLLFIPFITLKSSSRSLLLMILVLLAIILNFQKFRPHDFLGRGDGYYLNRYIPVPSASADYRQTQEEYLRLPIWSERRPDQNYPAAFGDIRIAQVAQPDPLTTIVTTSDTQAGSLNFNRYNFPGWKVRLDGNPVQIRSGQPWGQVTVAVPPGQHTVKLWFSETTIKRVLDLFALATLAVALWLIFRRERLWVK